MSDEKIGMDLVDNEPDYTKTLEENIEECREKYYKVYGPLSRGIK